VAGNATYVTAGTANVDTSWVMTTTGVITVGTTSLTFSQFGGNLVTSVFTRTGAVTAQSGDYTLNQIGNATGDYSLNSHKITSLANGSGAQDAAAFGQIPTALPPNGAASGDLTGTYPSPTFDLTKAHVWSATETATALIASGLTGATAASRYVGATASAAPVSGTFSVGDFAIDQTGKLWVNTVAGTPGTWVNGSAGPTGPTGAQGPLGFALVGLG
jgi:hypothetical protein